MTEPRYRHICEVCGKTDLLTSEEGFQAGWDYPPRMGVFGVVSPRTCGSCVITGTLWWRITTGATGEFSTADQVLLARIEAEPESILIRDGFDPTDADAT